MNDAITRDLARACLVAFAVMYLAIFATLGEGHLGWMISLLNGVGVLGVVAY